MDTKVLLVLTMVLVAVSAQKLYFKSNILMQKLLQHYEQGSSNMVVCPGNKATCPQGNTCCKAPTGGYGCCPLPKAVCCSDGSHCCPTGSKCDMEREACIRGEVVLPWHKKTSAVSLYDDDETEELVICPDGTSQCPDGNTCCQQPSGQYGCCPLPQAVCCSDGVHCCPNGYTCHESTCTRSDVVLPWYENTMAITTEESVICPGGTSECPDGNTCCKLTSGQYGCCPSPHAVCCSDGIHCCPNGYTCDGSTCTRGDVVLPWYEKTLAITTVDNIEKEESVICPDGTSECPDGNTCCQLTSGQYGCCPLPHAVCCVDELHCCPEGYTCDGSTCTQGDVVLPWYEKILPITTDNKMEKEESVICPGGTSECPDGNTCCKLTSGQYGCCPLPQAVCCSDGIHCCPNGYTCEDSTCTRRDVVIQWYEKTLAITTGDNIEKEESVICPDGTSECPDGNTCCQLTSGQYGCCPLPHAVCCSDGIHCCPYGYTCEDSTCTRGDVVLQWYEKTMAITTDESVICPDVKSQCPDGSTCCKLTSGGYGCCPLPNAVCCSDGMHCCPEGYTCGGSTCTQGDVVLPWYEKTLAITTAGDTMEKEESVICPDGKSQCPDGSTCCKLASGKYGCCPLPEAVCCSDHIHCCPHDTKCDVSSGTCISGNTRIDWFVKSPAMKAKTVKCDTTNECPNGNTCCLLNSGQWGCCPLPKAICCSDEKHCCPLGYTCDSRTQTCAKGDVVLPWYEKTLPMVIDGDIEQE